MGVLNTIRDRIGQMILGAGIVLGCCAPVRFPVKAEIKSDDSDNE